MHQSPEKKLANRRDKYVEFDMSDSEAERRLYRASKPKARRYALRDEPEREFRHEKGHGPK
jgi:hypothetical protein